MVSSVLRMSKEESPENVQPEADEGDKSDRASEDHIAEEASHGSEGEENEKDDGVAAEEDAGDSSPEPKGEAKDEDAEDEPQESKKKRSKPKASKSGGREGGRRQASDNESDAQAESGNESGDSREGVDSEVDVSDQDDDDDYASGKRKRKAAQPKKPKRAKPKPKVKRGKVSNTPGDWSAYTETQRTEIEKLSESLKKYNVTQLKAMLRKNAAAMSGRKDELLHRVAEFKTMGVPPKCSSCGGGTLKFNNGTGEYFCKGFFDEGSFQHCNTSFSADEIRRNPWVDLSG